MKPPFKAPLSGSTLATHCAFRLLVLLAAVMPSGSVLAENPKRLHVVGNVDGDFLQKARKAHDSIPNGLWKQVDDAGWSIQLAEFVVDAAPFLRGRHPRGWPEGTGWEQTDGVHLPQYRWIIIAEKRQTTRGDIVEANRVAGVLRHELGHAVDTIRGSNGKQLTESTEFRRCYSEDIERMAPAVRSQLAYYLQAAPSGPREAFAELFANRFGGGSDRDNLETLNSAFPMTRKLLQKTIASSTAPSRAASIVAGAASE